MSAEILASSLINNIKFKVDFNSFRNSLKTIEKVKKALRDINNGGGSPSPRGARERVKASNAEAKALRVTAKEYSALARVQGKLSGSALTNHYQAVKKLGSEYRAGTIDLTMYNARMQQLTRSALQANRQLTTLQSSGKKGFSMSGVGAIGTFGRVLTSGAKAGLTAGVVAGGASYAGYNKVKNEGQQYENISILFKNIFEDQADQQLQFATKLAQQTGSTFNEFMRSYADNLLVFKRFGFDNNQSAELYRRQTIATAGSGLQGEQLAGFNSQFGQFLDQKTYDAYKEAFAWAPSLRADFEGFLKSSKGIVNFQEALQKKQFDPSSEWFRFITAKESYYRPKAERVWNSTSSQDTRIDNTVSQGWVQVFMSKGFQNAIKEVQSGFTQLAGYLTVHSARIGEVLGGVVSAFSAAAFQKGGILDQLSAALEKLSPSDITKFMGDFTTGLKTVGSALVELSSLLLKIISWFRKEDPKPLTPEQQHLTDAARKINEYRANPTTYSSTGYGAGSEFLKQQAAQKLLQPSPEQKFNIPSSTQQLTSMAATQTATAVKNNTGKIINVQPSAVNVTVGMKEGFDQYLQATINNGVSETVTRELGTNMSSQ